MNTKSDPFSDVHAYACRPWGGRGLTFYVQSTKGAVGDWGYTTSHSGAIPLSPYWQRRFAADCRRAGVTPTFIPAAEWVEV